MVARFIRQVVFLLLAVIMARAQEPFIVGNGYVGVHVFCHTQEYAVLLARLYLLRGEAKYLPNRERYHYGLGTIAFMPLETVTVVNHNKETLFILKVLSTDVVYIIADKPATKPHQQEKSITVLRARNLKNRNVPIPPRLAKRSSP